MAKLGRFAQIARDHLRKHRPKLYRELKRTGELEAFLLDRQEAAELVMKQMLRGGASYDQAWEVAKDELYLPSEEDQPLLGENPSS